MRVGLGEKDAVRIGVQRIDGRQGWAPENKRRAGLAAVRVERDHAPRRVVYEHCATVVEQHVELQRREVETGVVYEHALRTEGETPHRRMETVGADNEIESPRGAALEGHVDAAGVRRKRGDAVVEDHLHAITAGAVEHRGQVAARQLELGTASTAQGVHLKARTGPAPRVNEDYVGD